MKFSRKTKYSEETCESKFPLGSLNSIKRRLNKNEALFLVFILPILALFAADPDSFIFGWNQGRGGFLFALVFIIIEWFDAKVSLASRLTPIRLMGFTLSLLGIAIYFLSVYMFGFHGFLIGLGRNLGLALVDSWIWMWDYVAFILYLAGTVVSLFKPRIIKNFLISTLYLLGMAIILFLDAKYPYESLGGLQAIVPTMLMIVASLLWAIGVPVETRDNLLMIWGERGYVGLRVFWPSAGVHSMIIYFLIIVILMVKLHASYMRKLLYAACGAVGTFLVNVLRIFMISCYAAFVSADIEPFHQVIGEIMFLPWIALFIVSIVKVERRWPSVALRI